MTKSITTETYRLEILSDVFGQALPSVSQTAKYFTKILTHRRRDRVV